MISFNCTGRIIPVKESERMKTEDVKKFDSGWTIKTLNFQVSFGTSRVFMQISHGFFAGPNGEPKNKDNAIYTTIQEGDKYEFKPINYADRMDPDIIKKVPAGKKFVIDTNSVNIFQVEGMRNKFANGYNVNSDDMNKYGIYNLNQADDLLDTLHSNRKEYIYVGDFYRAVKSIMANPDMLKHKYRIYGDYEIRYAETKGTFYKTFVPKKIFRIPDDQEGTVEEKLEMNFDFYFSQDSFDDSHYTEDGKCTMNGYVKYYDSQYRNDACKGVVYCPLLVTLSSQEEKYIKAMKRKFANFDNCEYKCMRLNCNYIDGAEKKEITMDDLTEETRSDIECGLLDFEEVKKQFGGTTYGDRVNEIRYMSYDASFGIQETELVEEDMSTPEHTKEKSNGQMIDKVISTQTDDDDDDIFDLSI